MNGARAAPVAPGMPAGPADAEARTDTPDGVRGDSLEAVALERDDCRRAKPLAGGEGAAQVAEALLADGERDGSGAELRGVEQPPDDVEGNRDRRRVVANARADQGAVVAAGEERSLSREDRVDVRRDEQARTPGSPRPQ